MEREPSWDSPRSMTKLESFIHMTQIEQPITTDAPRDMNGQPEPENRAQ